jgi:hypothetical protein
MTRDDALNQAASLFRLVVATESYRVSEATAMLALARAEAAKGLVQLARELRES